MLLFIVFSITGCKNDSASQNKVDVAATIDSIVPDDSDIPVIQPKYKIKIKDEKTSDPALVSFMKRFEKVIQNKDAKELLNICDESIVLSFGGGVFGKENFVKDFKLNNKNSAFWSMSKKYLKLGGEIVYDDGIANYKFPPQFTLQNPKIVKEPENAIFNVMHIIKDSAVVFEKPDIKSKKVAFFMMGSVLWDNQKSIGSDDEYLPEWCYVYTFDKKISGFVNREYLYAEPEYSFGIEKKNGVYKIVSFAPFD
jgi:hypothetical protein